MHAVSIISLLALHTFDSFADNRGYIDSDLEMKGLQPNPFYAVVSDDKPGEVYTFISSTIHLREFFLFVYSEPYLPGTKKRWSSLFYY